MKSFALAFAASIICQSAFANNCDFRVEYRCATLDRPQFDMVATLAPDCYRVLYKINGKVFRDLVDLGVRSLDSYDNRPTDPLRTNNIILQDQHSNKYYLCEKKHPRI